MVSREQHILIGKPFTQYKIFATTGDAERKTALSFLPHLLSINRRTIPILGESRSSHSSWTYFSYGLSVLASSYSLLGCCRSHPLRSISFNVNWRWVVAGCVASRPIAQKIRLRKARMSHLCMFKSGSLPTRRRSARQCWRVCSYSLRTWAAILRLRS